jgi:hypothetical protein
MTRRKFKQLLESIKCSSGRVVFSSASSESGPDTVISGSMDMNISESWSETSECSSSYISVIVEESDESDESYESEVELEIGMVIEIPRDRESCCHALEVDNPLDLPCDDCEGCGECLYNEKAKATGCVCENHYNFIY